MWEKNPHLLVLNLSFDEGEGVNVDSIHFFQNYFYSQNKSKNWSRHNRMPWRYFIICFIINAISESSKSFLELLNFARWLFRSFFIILNKKLCQKKGKKISNIHLIMVFTKIWKSYRYWYGFPFVLHRGPFC